MFTIIGSIVALIIISLFLGPWVGGALLVGALLCLGLRKTPQAEPESSPIGGIVLGIIILALLVYAGPVLTFALLLGALALRLLAPQAEAELAAKKSPSSKVDGAPSARPAPQGSASS